MKDERIFIAVEKDDVPVHFGKFTKYEAIEKMARAMIERYNSERTLSKWEKEWNKKNPKEAYKYFYIDAEAALKALLEN